MLVLILCMACGGTIAPGEFDGSPQTEREPVAATPTPAPRLGLMGTAAATEESDPHLPVVSPTAGDAGAPPVVMARAPEPQREPEPVSAPPVLADAGAAPVVAPAPAADAAPQLAALGEPCQTDSDCADGGACWFSNAGTETCHPSRASGWRPGDCIPTDPCRAP